MKRLNGISLCVRRLVHHALRRFHVAALDRREVVGVERGGLVEWRGDFLNCGFRVERNHFKVRAVLALQG